MTFPQVSLRSRLTQATELKIRGRLMTGFALLGLLFVGTAGLTAIEVSDASQINQRIAEERVPTTDTSMAMVSGINGTLASLRGWMITGNPKFKTERLQHWKQLDRYRTRMDHLAKNWTNHDQVTGWADFKETMAKFRSAQQSVEDISWTAEAQPATQLLHNNLMPLRDKLVHITERVQKHLGRSDQPRNNQDIALKVSKLQSSIHASMTILQTYIQTGDNARYVEFKELTSVNKKTAKWVEQRLAELAPDAAALFVKYQTEFAKFVALSARLQDIRTSPKWDMANHLLVTDAAPRASKMLTFLAGTQDTQGARNGGVLSEQRAFLENDVSAAASRLGELKILSQVYAVIGVISAICIALMTARSIVKPTTLLNDAMQKLAGGDTTQTVPVTSRHDEIGDMARTVEIFQANLREIDQMQSDRQILENEREQKEQELTRIEKAQRQETESRMAIQENRAKQLDEMIGRFNTEVGTILSSVETATNTMHTTAQDMSAAALKSAKQADTVANVSGQTTSNVQAVAVATEELSSSISEVRRQVHSSGEKSHTAVKNALQTNEKVTELSAAAQKIGDVVNMITDIAGQTNLLALNATIEAARAGDAGKGFAVVASEVKTLASQTSRATEEIARQITDIQAATGVTVDAVANIAESINDSNKITEGIVESIAQQNAATAEIASNANLAASGTQQVSVEIESVNHAASETGRAAAQMLSSVDAMSDQTRTLRTSVDRFLGEVRAV